MDKTRIDAIGVSSLLAGLLWLLSGVAGAATITVNCDAGDKIQGKLSSAKPGDILLVSGTCNENVDIPAEVSRITLDGQGKAAIHGPDSTQPTVFIIGREITLKGFTITGGRWGISIARGATAVIDRNTIQNTGAHGMEVAQNSFARIVNNTIQNNPRTGIAVLGSSSVHIGVLQTSDRVPSPNTIQNNGSGILVVRSSTARIMGNTISNNKGNGVLVQQASHADIGGNTFNGNGRNGIHVVGNSAVNLADSAMRIFEQPNSTTSDNQGFGIQCELGGYADGRLGTLNGAKGAKDVSGGCVDNLKP